NSPHLVQPQPAIGCLDDAGDRTQGLAGNSHSPEPSLAEKHQSKVTAHPGVLPTATNDVNVTHVKPIILGVNGNLCSVKKNNVPRSVTEPDFPRPLVDIAGAGSLTEGASHRWNSCRPGMKVPDSLIEVNESNISEFDPQSTISSARDELPHPIRHGLLGQRK